MGKYTENTPSAAPRHGFRFGRRYGTRAIRAACGAGLLASALLAFPAPAGETRPDLRPAAAQNDPQEQTALIELDGTGSESPDGGELLYRWRQIEGPKVELSDPTAAKPYFRTGKAGFYRFELIVTANGLESEPFFVDLEIERQNLPPVAIAPPEVFGEVGKLLEIDARESFDPEGQSLTYRWRSLTRGLEIPVTAMTKPVLSLEPKYDGVYEVELVVSDGETVSPPAIVRVGIKPKPRPPVARGTIVALKVPTVPQTEQAMAAPAGVVPTANIKAPSVVQLGDTVILDARSSSGSGNNRLEYLWRQKSGPFISDFELVFDGAAERFSPPREGDYEFELIVSDGGRESRPVVHTLRVVKEADPPVAVVVAPARAMPGALVKMDATQSYDLAGSSLIYRWRQTGGPKVTNYVIDEKIGDAAPAFHPPTAGVYSFELVVSNGKLQSKPVEIDIEVGNVRRPPKLSLGGPEVVNTGERLEISVKADQPNLSFVWRQTEGPAAAFQGQPRGAAVSFAPPLPGRYGFDVAAVDNGQIVATAHRVVEVFGTPTGTQSARPSASASALPAVTRQPVLPNRASPAAPAPTQAPAQDANSSLTPLLDMPPALSPPPQTGLRPAPGEARSARPAAQIHPSTLSGGLYNPGGPPPLEPLPPLADLP